MHAANIFHLGNKELRSLLRDPVMLFLILMGSIDAPRAGSLVLMILMLAICTPLASLLARLVEGKRFTFTVGGAVFAGLIISPWIIWLVNILFGDFIGFRFPILATLSAMAVDHLAGEGMGRLACISFGCCYGKPLHTLSPLLRRFLAPFSMTFFGTTKKIAYAHGFDGQPVVPVQAMTAVLYAAACLLGIWFFLEGSFVLSFAVAVGSSHGWRILSEFLRADYRGDKKFSTYQWMSLLAFPYAAALLLLFPPSSGGGMHLVEGLASLWSPEMILFIQALWGTIFVYTGKSKVTAAEISLYVVKDKI